MQKRQASLKVPAAGEYRGQTGVRPSCLEQGVHRANELGRPHQPRRPRARGRHRARSDPTRVRYLWNDLEDMTPTNFS